MGNDITELIRIKSICAGNGIALENKINEKEKKKKVKKDDDKALEETFLYEMMKVNGYIK